MHRKWTSRLHSNQGEESVNSEPEQSRHEQSLSGPCLDISTSSLPSDLHSQPTSRLTRSKAALLKHQGLTEPTSFSELPTKRRKTRNNSMWSECVSRERTLDERVTDVSECASLPSNHSCRVKSSSPNQPFIDCKINPSPHTSKQPKVRVICPKVYTRK